MFDLHRTTVPARLAMFMAKDIRSGKWTGRLPGYRILSRHYGVSRTSCDAAFELLEKQGVLAASEARKSRRILSTTAKGGTRSHSRSGTLLIIIDSYQQDSHSDPLLGMVRDYWQRSHGEVREVSDDLVRYKNPRPRLERWIQREDPDCIAFYVAPSRWATAARKIGIPFHLLGGALPKNEKPPAGSGFEIIDNYQSILERLVSLDHRRILSPTHLARKRLRDAMLKAYVRVFGEDGEAHEEWVPQFRELDPRVWQSYWQQSFSRLEPTAVIVENCCALLSLYGYCADHGIRIPRDLSVVAASGEEILQWVHPLPTRMRFPHEKAVRHFQNWVRNDYQRGSFRFLNLEWQDGDTLARARRK